MRSNPASEPSHVNGAAEVGAEGGKASDSEGDAARSEDALAGADARDTRDARDSEKPRDRPRGRLEIELEVSRQRSVGWTMFGIIFGGLLVWKLGTVGVWAGVILIVTGLYHVFRLLQTMRHPPGTIIVSDREVSLPRGVCMPDPVVVRPEEVTAAYFLRRSVPWNRASPVLIIELGPKAMVYPRDWFASEADQRHVIHALRRDKTSTPVAESA